MKRIKRRRLTLQRKRFSVSFQYRSRNRLNRHNDRYPQRKQPLLDILRAYIRKHQRSPTLRELCSLTGWSLPTVHSYLRRLKEDGLINYQDFQSRSARIR